MSDRKFDERTTEEFRAINDVEIKTSDTQKNNYKLPLIIITVSLVILVVLTSVKYLTNLSLGQELSLTNKDEALRYVWESDNLKFTYENKDLSVENIEEIFLILESDTWKKTNEKLKDESEPLCIMKLDSDYFIEFYNDLAVVSKGNFKTNYKVDSGIIDTLCVYLQDNTYISVDDMSSLLSVSENLTLEINGTSCVTSKGQAVANSLNTSTWDEIQSLRPLSNPFLMISDPIGLKVSIYDSEKIAEISYKGNIRYYMVDELVPASAALTAKSIFDSEAMKIASDMENCKDLIVVADGKSFRTDSNSVWIGAVSFESWTRRFNSPAAIPESADITIFDDISFVLKIYEDLLVAEYENSYYNIPETVIASIKSYLLGTQNSKDDDLFNNFKIPEFVSQIMKHEYLYSDFSGNSTMTSVNSELISALSINSWEESLYVAESYDIILRTSEDSVKEGFVIYINSSEKIACIDWNGIKQYYRTISDMSAVIKYIQNNVYTEVWQISATELGTLQNSATSIETIITNLSSEKNHLSSDIIGVSEIIKLSASLNLTPLQTRPDPASSEKIEMTFKTESNKFLVSYYKDSENRLIVAVSGTLSDIGKRIERTFFADGIDYKSFENKLKLLEIRMYDIVAGTFVESIKSMNSDSLNELTGNIFDYANIANVKFNTITFERSSELGKYILKFNVEDPEDGPFPKGESSYVLLIGTSDGGQGLKVKSLTESSEYSRTNIQHEAITTVNYFSSWYMSENPYFESFDKVTSKKAAVDFLMILALREELNLYNSQDPMGMYFTQEVINKMSLKYFNVSEFNARDTSAYNSETGLYSYTNTAVPVDLEKITDFEEDTANNRYYVTISRFEDPLYLYKIREVTYTLDKSSDGIYRILSAKEPASDNNAKNTDNSADLTTNGYSTDSEATND